jgi:hypothetical protein
MTKVAEQELRGIRLDLIRFFYFRQPDPEHPYLFELGFKPDYDSYERRGGISQGGIAAVRHRGPRL